jgi:hypothetical protein
VPGPGSGEPSAFGGPEFDGQAQVGQMINTVSMRRCARDDLVEQSEEGMRILTIVSDFVLVAIAQAVFGMVVYVSSLQVMYNARSLCGSRLMRYSPGPCTKAVPLYEGHHSQRR